MNNESQPHQEATDTRLIDGETYHVVCHHCRFEGLADDEAEAEQAVESHRLDTHHHVEYQQIATDGGSRLRCASCRATVTLDDTLELQAPEISDGTIARVRICEDCRPDTGNKRPVTAYKDLLEAVIKRANGIEEEQTTLGDAEIMTDGGQTTEPVKSARLAIDKDHLDVDNPLHYLVALTTDARRYDGHWDGDAESAAKWAVAQWCQEIGWVPDLRDYETGEMIDKADDIQCCEAAFYEHVTDGGETVADAGDADARSSERLPSVGECRFPSGRDYCDGQHVLDPDSLLEDGFVRFPCRREGCDAETVMPRGVGIERLDEAGFDVAALARRGDTQLGSVWLDCPECESLGSVLAEGDLECQDCGETFEPEEVW